MSRLAPLSLVLALLASAGSAAAYRVVTTDGRSLESKGLARVGGVYRIGTPTGTVELAPGTVDFYATFKANATEGGGNVVAFVAGGFLRFQSLVFSPGRVTFEISEKHSITVPETVIDFQTSVLEASFIVLPAGKSGRVSVAKATESPAYRPPEPDPEPLTEPEPPPEPEPEQQDGEPKTERVVPGRGAPPRLGQREGRR